MLTGEAFRTALADVLARYRAALADGTDDLGLLLERMEAGDALDSRRTFPGHVTTSAIVLDPSARRVLLVHHRATGRWLQPGGHWEPAPSFAASAQREAEEETGVAGLRPHPWHAANASLPIDVDTHAIPARPSKDEPDHWHFDLRYVFVADDSARLCTQADEVAAAEWRSACELRSICPRVWRRLSLGA
ncbi:NUDIX hydrolase [Alsobacter sp. R-9]